MDRKSNSRAEVEFLIATQVENVTESNLCFLTILTQRFTSLYDLHSREKIVARVTVLSDPLLSSLQISAALFPSLISY